MKWIIPVLLILMVSGCTVPGIGIEIPFLPDVFGGQTGTSDIVIIKQLNTYPEKIRKEQTIRVVAYIQNVGSKEKVGKGTTTQFSDKGITVKLYDYCTGVFNIKETACKGITSGASDTCVIDRIYPQETVEVSWELESASQSVNLETPCTLKVSAEYPYKTSVLSTINFINEDEMRRMIEDGSFKTKTSVQTTGEGPVKPNIKVLEQQPIPAKASSSGNAIIEFEISDRGSGFVTQKIESPQTKYDLWVTEMEYTNKNSGSSCRFPEEDKDTPFSSVRKQITLMREKSSIITCKLAKPPVSKERMDNMRMAIEYLYEVRKEKKVTLLPDARNI